MANAWQAYIDNLLASKNLVQAAIVGQDGTVWASSSGFNVTPDEIKHIVGGFQRKEGVQSAGVRICGQKYFYLQSDDHQMQCKSGNNGCSLAKAKTCVVIGVYGEGQQPGGARNVVESMANYLQENGI
jgi:profilin